MMRAQGLRQGWSTFDAHRPAAQATSTTARLTFGAPIVRGGSGDHYYRFPAIVDVLIEASPVELS